PAIRRHSGRILKRLGDGLMAVFASPAAALRAALEMQQAARGVRLRIGIHAGAARSRAGDLIGHEVNVAARIAERAPGREILWSGTSAVVARALRLIAAGALDEGGVDGLADRLGLGARQLRRLFATHLGASPAEVARARRAHFARTLLDETDLPMAEVAFSAGFGSIRDFNHALRATFGRTPTALRRARGRRGPVANHGGVTVRLAFRPPLDWSGLLGFL